MIKTIVVVIDVAGNSSQPQTSSLDVYCANSTQQPLSMNLLYGTDFSNLSLISLESRQDIIIKTSPLLIRHFHLTNIMSTSEGVYQCLLNFSSSQNPQQPLTVLLVEGMIFLSALYIHLTKMCTCILAHICMPPCFSSAHAFFRSCPETRNGKDCNNKRYLQSAVNSFATFDTRLGFRNGGSCSIKQRVSSFQFIQLGESNSNLLYSCSNGPINLCHNSSRVSVSYHGKDNYDVKLTLNDLLLSDSGRYELRVVLTGNGQAPQSIPITRKFVLSVI